MLLGGSYKEVQSFQSFHSPSSFFVVEEDMEAVNLRYLDLVAQSFLEIMQVVVNLHRKSFLSIFISIFMNKFDYDCFLCGI